MYVGRHRVYFMYILINLDCFFFALIRIDSRATQLHALERFDLLNFLKSIKEKTEKSKTDSRKKFTNKIQENCIEILNSAETYTA